MINKGLRNLKAFAHQQECILVFLCLLLESPEKEHHVGQFWKTFLSGGYIKNELFELYRLLNKIANIGRCCGDMEKFYSIREGSRAKASKKKEEGNEQG